MPVVEPTVAIAVLELDQSPPRAASVNVMVFPAHKELGPKMVPAFGAGFTVTVVIADPHAVV
jgi:hypothetical protein